MKKPKDFEKEKGLFYLLEMITNQKESECFTDEETYLIGRSNRNYPTWIWNQDSLSEEKQQKIRTILEEHYLEKENLPFTSKKELYEDFTKFYTVSDYFEMAFLSCEKLNNISLASGFMDTPSREDKEVLKQYWRDFSKTIELETISEEELEKLVEKWLTSNQFYVWRNPNGKVVSMATFTTESDLAKISHVYTPKEERRKGYCASLIYSLTKMLLEKKLKPMLYTDNQYEASNKAYQKVGYQQKGLLINYKMKNL